MKRNYIVAAFVGATVLAVALAGAMAVSGAVGADSPAETEQQQIAVDATGEAEAEPDKALVTLAVTAEGDEPAEIRDELAIGADELTAALEQEGVEYETIQFSIREAFHPREDPERDAPEYEGVHAFEVTVDDPDAVGEIIDVAANTGAEVGNIQMTLDEDTREQLRDEAIEDAMDDARHQADTIAASGGLQVVDIVTVDASQQYFRGVEVATDDVADGEAPPTDIVVGEVSVSYAVDVTFEATS